MAVDIRVLNENTWALLNEGFVRLFLLEGENEALIIDTGAFFPDIIEIIEQLSEKPYKLILTHADGDHCNEAHLFEPFYMSSSEAPHYYKHGNRSGEYIPVEEGDIFDLGGRRIKVINLPGHTPGSIGLLDIDNRVLYGGDTIQNSDIFMFGDFRDIRAYCHTLEKLKRMSGSFDVIYASHGKLEMEPEMIDRLYSAAKDIMDKKYKPEQGEFQGTPIDIYDVGCARFFMDRE